eukprot:gene8073-9931_t
MDDIKELQESLKCLSCGQQYNQDDRLPKIIFPCGETLCSSCLSIHSNCPSCYTHITSTTYAQQLIVLLKQFKKIVNNNNNNNSAKDICNNKSDNENNQKKCLIHCDEDYYSFCSDCQTPICPQCIVQVHNGHRAVQIDVDSFNSYLLRYADQYRVLEEHSEFIQMEIQEVEKKIMVSKDFFQRECDKIGRDYEKLKSLLSMRELKFKSELSSQYKKDEELLTSRIAQLKTQLAEKQKHIQFYRDFIQELITDPEERSQLYHRFKFSTLEQIHLISKLESPSPSQPLLDSILKLEFQSDQLESLEYSIQQFGFLNTKIKENYLYFIGGIDKKNSSSSSSSDQTPAYRLNLKTKNITILSPNPSPLFHVIPSSSLVKISLPTPPPTTTTTIKSSSSTTTNETDIKNSTSKKSTEFIYIVGGYYDLNKQANIYRYDIDMDQWSLVATNSMGMGSNTSVQYDGDKYIYMFGGFYPGSRHDQFEKMKRIDRFNVETNTIENQIGQMVKPKFQAFTCYDNQRYIYIVGGFNERRTVDNYHEIERFDLESKQCKLMFQFPINSCGNIDGSIIFQSYIYILGSKGFIRLELNSKALETCHFPTLPPSLTTTSQQQQKQIFQSLQFGSTKCSKQIIKVNVGEGNVSLVKCSEPGCDQPFDPTIIQQLVSEEIFELYQKLVLRKTGYIECNRCPKGWARVEQVSKTAFCGTCRHFICLLCKSGWHPGTECYPPEKKPPILEIKTTPSKKVQPNWRIMRDPEFKSNQVQFCPSCGILIYKYEGCHVTTCSYCTAKFCWFCLSLLINGSYIHDCTPPSKSSEDQLEEVFKPQDYVLPLATNSDMDCGTCGRPIARINKNNHLACSSCKSKFCFLCKIKIQGTSHFSKVGSKCKQHGD